MCIYLPSVNDVQLGFVAGIAVTLFFVLLSHAMGKLVEENKDA
jgi:hypothetical protein